MHIRVKEERASEVDVKPSDVKSTEVETIKSEDVDRTDEVFLDVVKRVALCLGLLAVYFAAKYANSMRIELRQANELLIAYSASRVSLQLQLDNQTAEVNRLDEALQRARQYGWDWREAAGNLTRENADIRREMSNWQYLYEAKERDHKECENAKGRVNRNTPTVELLIATDNIIGVHADALAKSIQSFAGFYVAMVKCIFGVG